MSIGSVGVALTVLLAGTGCDPRGDEAQGQQHDSGQAAGVREFHEQDLTWEECGGELECAQVEVPLDYDEPEGQTLHLALTRLPAQDEAPEGSLLVNPGGPGGSGTEYAAAAAHVISPDVRENFDVVGFDPRGVGESDPIECLEESELDAYLGAELEPADPDSPGALTSESRQELEQRISEFVDSCVDNAGDLLEHLGTDNVARDMDVLRAVLGDEGLTYLGKSYGTLIGAHYAELFPEQVRALVLDGAVDPTLTNVQMSAQQASGFHTALEAFLEDCLDRADCPLSADTVPEGVDELGELIADAREEPLPGPEGDDRMVNGARVELGLASSLYSEQSWPQVRSALDSAYAGDGAGLLELADRMYNRQPGGNYTNMVAALNAVNCADRPSPESVAEVEQAAQDAAAEAPLFGASLVWGALICSEWPVGVDRSPAELTGQGASDIVVVGTTRDSATPYSWSEELADDLDSGVLLTYDGDGHTAYGTGNGCVDEQVDAYILDGVAPEEGVTCPAQ
ncbi:alpha/beta hydrolase [Lipingzhangella rawalii]|uniref:alpha/beta hydrolase n=1 Tax=Lipingzhangella rawalii TaxID=2055835 RepID=UPI00287BC99A|nr:alpha/beta hydrolase [Lipingzhangella rawalii]